MKPKLGDRAFEVEWCTEIPIGEFGDRDLDRATYEVRIVPTREAADKLAAEVWPADQFGSVRITEVELSDPFGDRNPRTYLWEAVRDSEFYDGPDESR